MALSHSRRYIVNRNRQLNPGDATRAQRPSRSVIESLDGDKAMKANQVHLGPELHRVLWAVFDYWNAEPLPLEERSICYTWIVRRYQNKFDGPFHQSRLQELARLGLLEKDDAAHQGNRRYYKVSDPAQVAALLKDANMN